MQVRSFLRHKYGIASCSFLTGKICEKLFVTWVRFKLSKFIPLSTDYFHNMKDRSFHKSATFF